MNRDIQDISIELSHIKAESLESTKRIVIYAQESEEIADKTMADLDDQGEKLRRIKSMNNRIEQINSVVDRDITIINRFCGCCCCFCPVKAVSTPSNNAHIITVEPVSARNISAKQVTVNFHGDEISENLGIASEIVARLKQKAIDMGTELDQHNDILDTISDKTIKNTNVINTNTKRIT